jgi:hypothetical protein
MKTNEIWKLIKIKDTMPANSIRQHAPSAISVGRMPDSLRVVPVQLRPITIAYRLTLEQWRPWTTTRTASLFVFLFPDRCTSVIQYPSDNISAICHFCNCNFQGNPWGNLLSPPVVQEHEALHVRPLCDLDLPVAPGVVPRNMLFADNGQKKKKVLFWVN